MGGTGFGRLDERGPGVMVTDARPRKHHARTAMDAEAEATIPSSVFNVVNNITGVGILSLPWVMRQSGLFVGMLVIVGGAALNGLTCMMLVHACEMTGCFNFRQMVNKAFGPAGGPIVAATTAIYVFGSCASYIVLIGDAVPAVMRVFAPEVALFERVPSMILVTLLAMFPLSLLKDLNGLRFTSFAALICVLYTTMVVLFELGTTPRSPTVSAFGTSVHVLGGLPIVNVAFTLHYNVPRFYQELKDRSVPKMFKVLALSLGTCTVLYLLVAVSGYLLFGDNTDGDVLNNFEDNDTPALVARLAMAIVVTFTFPLSFHCLRSNVLSLAPQSWQRSTSFFLFAGISAVLTAITLLIAIGFKHLEDVVAYKGALMGVCIVYVFPATVYGSLRHQLLSAVPTPTAPHESGVSLDGRRPSGLGSGAASKRYKPVSAESSHGLGAEVKGDPGASHLDAGSGGVAGDEGGVELTDVSLARSDDRGPTGISGDDVASAAAVDDSALTIEDGHGHGPGQGAAPGMVGSGERPRTLRYSCSALCSYCGRHKTGEGGVVIGVVAYGCIMALLGVLVTSGAIKSHKD